MGKDLKRARRRVNELEDALTERAQIEAELMTNNDELRDKVASLGRSYRRKLKQFIADMSDLSKALSEQVRRSFVCWGGGRGVSGVRMWTCGMCDVSTQTYGPLEGRGGGLAMQPSYIHTPTRARTHPCKGRRRGRLRGRVR